MNARVEPSSFEMLFVGEYAGVLRVASRIVGELVAEDVVQEAFVALHRRWPLEPAHARSLLYRTALHRALSARRSQLRRISRERALEEPAIEDPLEMAELRETGDLVRRLLLRGDRKYAAVLALRYCGYSYHDIADVLDVTVNHVGVLLVRAERAFEKELNRVSPR